MNIALSVWNGRIAPVFDVSQSLYLIEADAKVIKRKRMEYLTESTIAEKAIKLQELGIQYLICGAISRQASVMLYNQGIQVIPFICGDIDNVLTAWQNGSLWSDTFKMPGCCGRRRRFRGGSITEENHHVGKKKRQHEWNKRTGSESQNE